MLPVLKARQKRWDGMTREERKECTRGFTEAGIKITREKLSKMNKEERLNRMIPAIKANHKRWNHMTDKEKQQMTKKSIEAMNVPEARQKMSNTQKKRFARMTKEERLIRVLPWIRASQNANPSFIEKLIWKELDKLGIKYKTQVPFNHGKFIADIYIPAWRLIIECNGTYYHDYNIFPGRKIRDEAFEKYANSIGLKIEWLWESDIRENSKLILLNILKRSKLVSLVKL